MGAANSKPRMAQLDNQYIRPVAIEVTEHVVSRLEDARQQVMEEAHYFEIETDLKKPIYKSAETPEVVDVPDLTELTEATDDNEMASLTLPNQIVEEMPTVRPTPTDVSSLQTKLKETKDAAYEQTQRLLEANWGRPVQWTKKLETDLEQLRIKLIKCYNEYPKHSLECAETASEFQSLAFGQQYKAILKHKNIETHPVTQSSTTNNLH